MTLAPGDKIGPYEIRSRIGAGGMGEVWRAHDSRLNRDVAIKTSTAEFNPRFTHEARAVAALNHPNICHLYDVGPDYLVMELVEGQPIRGPVSLDEALRIVDQIAAAIDAAQEKGIVHRDLKPGNILITRDGLVKVLDFGLAHLPEPGDVHPETGSTVTVSAEIGAVMGTPSYMAPEQARGYAPDKRSDIWAFGVILYELLTDVQPFHSTTRTDTVLAVLSKEPDFSKIPYRARRLIRSCLEKDPKQRLRDIGDWRKLLDSDEPIGAESGPRRSNWTFIAAIAASLAAGAFTYRQIQTRTPVQSDEPIFTRLTDDSGLSDFPALSRDGKLVAYSSDGGTNGNLNIWLRQIGGHGAIQLTHDSDDASEPSFSPDGTHIAYRSEKNGGGIYVVSTLGGDAILLVPGGRTPRYSPDGKWIAYWTGRGEGSIAAGAGHVFVTEVNGGAPREVHPEMSFAKSAAWSPRSDAVIVTGWKGAQSPEDFWILPLDGSAAVKTGARVQLSRHGLLPIQLGMRVDVSVQDWSDLNGDRILLPLVYGDSANLWETQLTRKGALIGLPHRVTRGPGRQVHASRAVNGPIERLVFGDESVTYDVWSKPAGSPSVRLTNSGSTRWAPSLSLDGGLLTYIARGSGAWSVVARDLATDRERVLTTSSSLLINAAISGDGKRIAWSGEDSRVYVMSSATGPSEKLCDRCGTILSLSADGRYAAFEPVSNEDVSVIDSTDHRRIVLVPRRKDGEILSGTQFSPDGNWVAFHSIDPATRVTQVWVAPMNLQSPVSSQQWIPITGPTAFGQDPAWAPDGGTLYFDSERDGFRCYWAQRLDASKKPSGDPVAVEHFHSAKQTLRGGSSNGYLTRLGAGGKRLVYSIADVRGSVWLEEHKHAR